MSRRGLVLMIALGVMGLSCAGDSERQALDSLRVDAVAVEDLRIGAVEGPSEYVFGDVRDVVSDALGRVYVADRSLAAIRVYEPDGEFRKDIGGPGEGPGEFGPIAALAVGPDGRLYVLDPYRISVFSANPATGLWDVFDGATPLAGIPPRFRPRGAAVDEAGRLHYPVYRYLRDAPPQYAYLAFHSESGVPPDTLRVPPYQGIERNRVASYMISERTGRLVQGLSAAPFEPVPSWDVTRSGTIIGGPGGEYVLYETDASGDTVRTIRIERDLRPIAEAVLADSLRALSDRVAALPVPPSEISDASPAALANEVPAVHPAFIGVHVASDGLIWVELSHEATGRRIYDVLSPAGELLRTVQFEAPFSHEHGMHLSSTFAVGVVVDELTGVESVVRVVF